MVEAELAELSQLVGIKTPPQRFANAQANRQIPREGAAGDSLVEL